jgi:hypothetical protein
MRIYNNASKVFLKEMKTKIKMKMKIYKRKDRSGRSSWDETVRRR